MTLFRTLALAAAAFDAHEFISGTVRGARAPHGTPPMPRWRKA